MGARTMTPPLEPSSPIDGGIRKRVCKACDRCRLKKSKCDGSSPCSRCKADNAICVFGERKKSHDKVYPKGYVEMLENQQAQLVAGLQELYKRLQNGQGWTGAPLMETTRGKPLTHDILERLGALKQEGHNGSESFEEDLHTIQQNLIATGAGFMQQEASFDTNSDIDQSPIFDQMPAQPPTFTNPFPTGRFPPTPPNQSPYPQSARTSSPLKSQMPAHTIPSRPSMAWPQPGPKLEDSVDFTMPYDSPMGDGSMGLMAYSTQMYPDQAIAINPCLTMKDWQGQDEQLQRYFNSNIFS